MAPAGWPVSAGESTPDPPVDAAAATSWPPVRWCRRVLTPWLGLEEWLLDARQHARTQVEDALTVAAEEFAVAEQRRDELIRRCKSWLSLRALGELVDLSHTQVRRIIIETEG